VRQPRVGREFEAIRAAGPERSLRRAVREARDGGVSAGSDGNSTARSGPRRAPSAAPAPEARDGGVAPGRTGIRGDWRGGPGEIAPRRPRSSGGGQPRAGREFERPARDLGEIAPPCRPGSSRRGSQLWVGSIRGDSRRAGRDRSAVRSRKLGTGESAPCRTGIRSDWRGGPGEESLRRAGPGSSGRGETAPGRTGIRSDSCGRPGEIAPPRRPRKLGTGSQLWVGREFKAIGAAGPEKSLRRAGPEARDGGVSLGSDENSRRICGGPGGIAPPRRTGNPGRDESALRRTGIRNGGCGEHAKKIAPAVLRPRCDRVRVQFGCS
jgi:hypothetical protein